MACSSTNQSGNKTGNQIDMEDMIVKPLHMVENTEKMEQIVGEMIKRDISSRKEFDKFVREMRRKYKVPVGNTHILYSYRMMIKEGKLERQEAYEPYLKSRVGRGLSGVMVITVVTSPYPKSGEKVQNTKSDEKVQNTKSDKEVQKFSCLYDCHYCPAQPGQPRSYLMKEPAVLRANRNNFDAVRQFRNRGESYIANGHPCDKVELLILGGTWSSYPEDYKEEFVRDLFYAANTMFDRDFKTQPRERLSLEEEKKINETTQCRIIGLTIETRPDKINKKELQVLRRYGVTRVQIGIQHTDDRILKLINRQCPSKITIRAIKLLKDSCFKVDIHLMPDLPGASVDRDMRMFKKVLRSEHFQADQWKIYPCEVVPWTKIEEWYKSGIYKPYAETVVDDKNPLMELIIEVKTMVHPWIRLNRVIRDIPHEYILGGNDCVNMRQYIHQEMKKRGMRCKCIRCREVRGKEITEKPELVVRCYTASGGTEYFISYESKDRLTLYGFIRLRITDTPGGKSFPELKDCGLIRELHVYGKVATVNSAKGKSNAQHLGLGKKLLRAAEDYAFEHHKPRIAVISGVGVKEYYRKYGFIDEGAFLIKDVDPPVYEEYYIDPITRFKTFAMMIICFGVMTFLFFNIIRLFIG